MRSTHPNRPSAEWFETDNSESSRSELHPTVNILWTGGWDSTFQLLRLLQLDRVRVQPVYLLDTMRRSTCVEVDTMLRIKKQLLVDDPSLAALIEPTLIVAVGDLAKDEEVSRDCEMLRRTRGIGGQYSWFARLCRQWNLTDLQLCIHRDDKAYGIASEGHKFLSCFTFPILNLTKADMWRESEERNWMGVMRLTWFCHCPTRRWRPCGWCNPCIYTMDEGLSWRIPAVSRVVGAPIRWIRRRKGVLWRLLRHKRGA